MFIVLGGTFSLLVPSAFGSTAHVAVSKPPPPKIPPSAPAPAPAPVFSSFPKLQTGGAQSGGSPAPAPVYIPPSQPAPKPMVTENKFRPLKKVVIAKRPYIRPALFYTSAESFARSGVFFKPRAESDAVPGVISEAIIGMVTTLRESENDVQATKHEYESDLEKVETTRQLHAQNDALYRKNVIPKQTFEESFTALKKAVDKAEGAKARWMEYEAEVAINRWRLAQAKGETVTLVDKAKSHLRLWEARLAKVKAAENEAKAGFDYALLSYDIVKALEKTHAASRADVISAQRDWEEGVVLLKLAKKLVDRNTAHVEEAKDAVKQAERASSVGM